MIHGTRLERSTASILELYAIIHVEEYAPSEGELCPLVQQDVSCFDGGVCDAQILAWTCCLDTKMRAINAAIGDGDVA
jgi:hypothetical protein